ncbi:MAG TPA: hypothetical protein PLY13_04930, partial [Methanoregulaceae archaeon]|nr:hypothetical protein [Methanoregulaceae archaeon]
DPIYGKYAPGILYPSCAGLSAKYITEIKVYTTPESTWDLHLDGTRVGGIEHTIAKGYFEAALACQMGANHDASYTDASGNIWTGMPLWFLQGFVDDADQHSNNAYNEALALEGYDIIVMASDGYNKTFSSVDTVRSTGYILANTLNGYHIPEADASWPLRLLGDDVPKKDNVKKVSDIILNFKPNVSMAYPSQESLWPVNKDYVNVTIEGVTDPYDEVTISIISITSDEPTTAGGKNQAPDADPSCIGTDTARIRAERIGSGNGRVYEISFVATDSMGVSMEGTVNVFVPHDQGMVSECIDDGQMYDATAIN